MLVRDNTKLTGQFIRRSMVNRSIPRKLELELWVILLV